MSVTVAYRPAPWGTGLRATSGGGKGENVVQAAPGGGVPDVPRDGWSTVAQGDDVDVLEVRLLEVRRFEADLSGTALDADTGVAELYRTHWTPMVRLASPCLPENQRREPCPLRPPPPRRRGAIPAAGGSRAGRPRGTRRPGRCGRAGDGRAAHPVPAPAGGAGAALLR